MALRPIALVPPPRELQLLDGDLVLYPTTRILYQADLEGEAQLLADMLRRVTGFPFELITERPALGSSLIELEVGTGIESEGYHLVVTQNEIKIHGGDAHGVFHGIQTLLQLLPAAVYGRGPRVNIAWTVPHVHIKDGPHFGWRGAMLDCCRHFMPAHFVKKFIDVLAMHKMNVFHWHLTEDQGWRIEIKKYPRLTEVGAYRAETLLGHHDAYSTRDGIPHGGFYTQEEIREIVAYAAARHITIIPEIEVPGHCQAALASYPEYGPAHATHQVNTQWLIDRNAIFFPSEETFAFLRDVFTEVAELFPSEIIHVGGDEAIHECWENDPDARKIMAELGIETGKELQAYFIKRVRRILADLGRKLAGWDEILEGELEAGATITVWRGMGRVSTATAGGHDVVACSMEDTYFDYYQTASIEAEPLAIGGVLTLERTYGFNPIPADLPPGDEGRILGLQGQLWAEYMKTPEGVEYMAFPRMTAIAETGWCGTAGKDFGDFSERLRHHLKRLDVREVRYRPLE